MSTVGKKKVLGNEVRKVRRAKPLSGVKNIGLDEKIEEAERVLRSLKNPELLK